MKRIRGILILSIIIMLGILSGCSTKAPEQISSVRIAFFPNITHSQALIGKTQGQFQKEIGDIDVEWKQFNAGSSEMEALLAGAVDIGYIGPGPAISAYTKSRGDIQIIAGATDAGAILVAGKNTNIESPRDLDGKKIAIPQFGNTQDLSLRALLLQNGLKDTTKGGTVEILQAENPDIKTLLDNGHIDAALVPEPWGARLEKEVGAKVILDFNEVWRDGNYPTAVIVVRKEFLEAHKEIVEKFIKAHVELTEYIKKNKEEAKVVANEQIKELTGKALPKEVLDVSFERLTSTNDPKKQAIEEMVQLSVNTGFLKTAPDTKTLFNLEILNKVLSEKGQEIIQ